MGKTMYVSLSITTIAFWVTLVVAEIVAMSPSR